MINLKKKNFIIAITFILIMTFSVSVLADPLSDKLKKQRSQLQQNKDSYEQIQSQIDNTESIIEQMDNQIEDIMAQISSTGNKISATQAKIKVTEKQLEIIKSQLGKETELYNERLRAMYMNGSSGYIELILDSTNVSDFFERLEAAKSIMKFDTNLINDLENKHKQFQEKEAELLSEKNSLVKLQEENQNKLNELNAKKSEQNKLIKQLKAKEREYKDAIAYYNKIINATLKQIEEMKKRLKNSHNKGNVYSSDALVVYAASFLGVPYKWGGNTPKGFDCSGFTKYVYAHFGITLNRVSRDQFKQGTLVSKANLKPGDLVFFGKPIHHVGIYVGNNSFIHAPRTGDVVKISPLTRTDFVGGRRLR